MSSWTIVSVKVCVFLLIFCLVDLSIVVSGVLKSPTIIVLLLISSFILVSICLTYCGAPMLGAYIFIIGISSLDWSFDHYVVSFFVSFYSLYLKVYFRPCFLTSPILNQIGSRCACLTICALGGGALTLKEVEKTIVWCFLILWQKWSSNSHHDSIACRILWTLEGILDARQLK